ncbi:hypothetical protein OH77DRAFT_1070775 [Trametes cingulata]|nr:hypothetical protein OH77DRAFT_1070775 [Trametes cingulata]
MLGTLSKPGEYQRDCRPRTSQSCIAHADWSPICQRKSDNLLSSTVSLGERLVEVKNRRADENVHN